MKPLEHETLPSYWEGRLHTREAEEGPFDRQVAAEYQAIIAGLRAKKPLAAIPEYKAVSERVVQWAKR